MSDDNITLRQRSHELLCALKLLRSSAILFRDSAYCAEPTLKVSNEAVNTLSANLLAARKLIARIEQESA